MKLSILAFGCLAAVGCVQLRPDLPPHPGSDTTTQPRGHWSMSPPGSAYRSIYVGCQWTIFEVPFGCAGAGRGERKAAQIGKAVAKAVSTPRGTRLAIPRVYTHHRSRR